MLFMVADGNRRGVRHLLPEFWEHAADFDLPLPSQEPVSASAICQARQRLNSDVFCDLLYALSSVPGSHGKCELNRSWRGRRVFAADGAKINLKKSPELECAFGVPEAAHCPQVLMSALVDVCSRAPVDVQISGFRESEREHLLGMLESIDKGDLLILDRGYPSHEILQACSAAGIEFLVRVPISHSFAIVDEFRNSGASDAIMTLLPPKKANPQWQPLRVRMVRVEGPNGPAFYISSLTKNKLITEQDIADLYHMRWEAEEYFKLFTSEYIGQKQFRSTSAQGIIQEISALTLFLAISSLFAAAADQELTESEQFVSQKGTVLTLARFLTRILLTPNSITAKRAVVRAVNRILLTRDRPRPGRSFPRRSFKPTPKWCPSGRRGA